MHGNEWDAAILEGDPILEAVAASSIAVHEVACAEAARHCHVNRSISQLGQLGAVLGRADALGLFMAEVSALFAQLLTSDVADLATAEARALRVLIAAAETLDLTVSEGVTLDQVSVALAIALLALSHRAGTGVALSHRAGTDLAISHRRAA